MLDQYMAQVRLLVSVLPDIARETAFALKGGSAINLFYRDHDNEGLTDELFNVFMVYVASSGRPMHELLAPTVSFRENLYDDEFLGMTAKAVSRKALAETGRRLHADIRSRLHGDVAAFLLSLHDAEPDFNLIRLPEAAELPAVRWKLVNLEKLKQADPNKHASQRRALERLVR